MCRGMISGGLGDERERAPLDCGRRGRVNPLAGARWGFCACRRRDNVNVKQSERARMLMLGRSGFLRNDAVFHPVQFNSVRLVEGHLYFFGDGASKGRQSMFVRRTQIIKQIILIC